MNQTIGHIQCPICDTPGEVRRYKGGTRGSMYWACQCGQIRPVKSQVYILKNAEFYPDAGELIPPNAKLFTPKKPVTENTEATPVAEKLEPKKPAVPVTKPAQAKPTPQKPAGPVSEKPAPEKWGFF